MRLRWFATLAALILLPTAVEGFTVNVQNRQEVVRFFSQYYLSSEDVLDQWTGGSIDACVPGAPSQAYRDAVVRQINFMRAMAGPPEVALRDDLNVAAQDAALIMAANRRLSHEPDPSWKCYTADGASAAGGSELAAVGDASAGFLVNGFMQDEGNGNIAVGHRRGILGPPQQWVGVGNVNGWNALDMGLGSGDGPRPDTPNGIAWPPSGFVPWQIMPDRWSFSFFSGYNPGTDMSGATVTMTRNGADVPVSVIYRDKSGSYCGDCAIVWVPQGLKPADPAAINATFDVVISNVVANGVSRSFTRRVTVIDPLLEAVMITLYQNALGYTPSDAEVVPWAVYLRGDGAIERARATIHAFFKLQDQYRPQNIWQYVWDLYEATVGREPSAEDEGAVVNALLALYNTAIPGFTGSPEFASRLQQVGPAGVINALYVAMRGVPPSQPEFDAWMNWITMTGDYTDMVIAFTNSVEYLREPRSTLDHARFLYRGVLGREPSAGDATAWANAFLTLRALMEDGFVNSAEFKARYTYLLR